MVFYILYIIGYIIANILPLRCAYWVAERISDIQYNVSKNDREAVTKNLNIVLGMDIAECRVYARKVFRNFGLYLVDFFRMHRINKEDIDKRVRFSGLENIDNVLKENKGIIALTCHIGNWEMGGVTVALMGYDISVVALNHKNRAIDNFFIKQRERHGLRVITVSSTMKRCISVLLNKGILALVGDRDFTNTGIVVNFFGLPVSLPKGPAMLSLKTDSPIVPVFLIREDRYNYKLIFDKPIYLKKETGMGKDDIIRKATDIFIPVMERYIREYPDQWLVFRPFWETPKGAVVI